MLARSIVVAAAWSLGLISCAPTTTRPQATTAEAQGSGNCPAAGTSVPLAKVMNSSFIKDYAGCDVVVDADFYKMGNEGYTLGQYDTSANTTFQVLDVGEAPPSGGLGSWGKFSGTPKASSDVLFGLKQGDKVRLRGAPIGYYDASGNLIVGVFHATTVEKI